MYKQSSSGRNGRTKGFKVKHVVQACVLAAICVWLLYQVKHSHDKKKALEEGIIKISTVVDANHGFFRFGRKDIPHVDTGDSKEKIETVVEEDGNEYTDEVEAETKPDEHLEEEEEEEHLDHEDEDETGGNGEDGIDENDQDKERDNSEETTEEGDDEVRGIKHNQSEVHNGGGWSNVGRNYEASTQVARERNYKGDDVSSAVFRNFESAASEGGSQELMFNVEKNSDIQIGTTETDDGNDREFEFHQSGNGTMNATSKAEMEHEVGSLQMNSTTSESSNSTASNNSEAVVESVANHSSIDRDQNMTTTGIQILREPTDRKPNTTGTAIDAPFKDRTTVPYANHSTKFSEIEEKEEIAED